jgi:aerobic C4-dicarboxylate transport protein
MSEARALTNFAGNAVATVLVGTWTKEIDHNQAKAVLSGEDPFNELTYDDDPHATPAPEPGPTDRRNPEPATDRP